MTQKYFDDADNLERILGPSTPPGSLDFDINRTDHKMIGRLLKDLLNRLDRTYTINKASLTFYDPDQTVLRVTHMLTRGVMKSGLTLTIPNRSSLLYQILMQGYPVVDNYPKLVTGNIIEKKILLSSKTRSLLIIPLIHNNIRLGVLNLASPDESVFGLYLEGVEVNAVGEFVEQLAQTLLQTETARK
jgi:transcriptional regulator with GAF, ATPase, and Fis domain